MFQPDTPVMIMDEKGFIFFMKIKNIKHKYTVWDGKQWTKITNIKKYKISGNVYEILTNTGFIIVLENVRLLTPTDCVKPNIIQEGVELFSGFPLFHNEISTKGELPCIISEKYAYALGVFFARNQKTVNGIFNIISSDIVVMKRCKIIFEQVHPGTLFELEDLGECSCLYPVSNINTINIIYKRICYSDNDKIIPRFVLDDINNYKYFLNGFKHVSKSMITESQIGAAGLFFIFKNLNFNVNIKEFNGIFIFKETDRKLDGIIKRVNKKYIKKGDFFGLETGSGQCQVGVGTITSTTHIYLNNSHNVQQ